MSERSPKNILVVGLGGRENALGWKLSQSPDVDELFFAPGNGGTLKLGKNIDIGDTDVDRLAEFANEKDIDLTVIRPESSLQAGLANALQEDERPVFGPSKEAALLETSKAFAAEFVNAHDIPHPRTWVFSDPHDAIAHVERLEEPSVIKASGLAAGKGVFLPDTLDEAVAKIREIHAGSVSGITGDRIVIQERLNGREASIIAMSDGTTVVPFIPAQDYKRAYDGDKGPNTGGMGSFAPTPMDSELMAEIQTTILQPTIDGMAENGTPYKGILYVGLMLTSDGPKVIEYNARFGDPETQPLMMMLESDLYGAIQSSLQGDLSADQIRFREGSSVCVVLAEAGYPGKYGRGHEIHGLNSIKSQKDVQIFHAGTCRDGMRVLTNGGRVLGVTAYGNDLEMALTRAYGVIGEDGVWFDGMEWRGDIGR